MDNMIQLSSERVWRTYLGGSMIDKLHGSRDGVDGHFPEEWIMSTTACRNAGREEIENEGMCYDMASGRLLKDLIAEKPEKLLGKRHLLEIGDQPGVLVKLIDSSERLSIQVHPDRIKAKQYFHSDYGKTESWHILGGRNIQGEPPCIYLGFQEWVTQTIWQEIFEEQDIPKMLSCLNKIEVQAGDTFLIHGGIPHAIGAGCFLIEVQEPTDYTLRTEKTTPSGFIIQDDMCHQGIGFEKMMDCFDYHGMDREETIAKYKLTPRRKQKETVLIDYSDIPYFSLSRRTVDSHYESSPEDVFYGIYVLEGSGSMISGVNTKKIKAGDSYFVPADSSFQLLADSSMTIVKFHGPNAGGGIG